MGAFQVGIALKPSSLGDDERSKLRSALSLLKLSEDIGLSHLVLDSEREVDDLSLKSIGLLAEEAGSTKLVVTVPVRRRDARERFEGLRGLVAGSQGLVLCLVAGHPSYLDGGGPRVGAGALLRAYAAEAAELNGHGRELLVGTERVERAVLSLGWIRSVVPFVLMDSNSRLWAETFGRVWERVAVYVPLFVGEPSEDAMARMRAYVSRRPNYRGANGQDLEEGLRELTVFGRPEEVRARIERLGEMGFGLVVGWLIDPSPEQLRRLSRAL
ncbi:MAG: hypothetical protein N3H32_04530 [Nitrososphaeria archaeon]|nr:hypothetical protein [Nitrososphaeria archaeon]MDW8043686.1 hypothetical protein [Nitrososphaerota archaeon]